MKYSVKEFDVIIIGAGGAGMSASLQISKRGFSCALISKVFPTRSHTVSAQGGITVALGNQHKDDWQWHMYDTVKGSDYIGDQNAIEYMCKSGPEVVLELEHMGLPFSRSSDGKIYQRSFGGQSINYGDKQAARTASSADRTGHALLHTLYQQNLKNNTTIFSEWYTIDLVKNQEGVIVGCTALCIETGELVYFKSRATVLATGGGGRIYQSTTNSYTNTGDGIGMAIRSGIPVQDMEMWQFHPTGIVGKGILITEGCRGEGGYLLNRYGDRFMEYYAPNAKDLAGRDVVSRSIMIEIQEGRGYDSPFGQYVKLKVDHLGENILKSRLPGVLELSRTFANIDPLRQSIPVVPTCHYMMGGIPTKINGQVITVNEYNEDVEIPGLFAIGETACTSVHGANRLGGNSLLDLIVFGRTTGIYLKEFLHHQESVKQPSKDDIFHSLTRYQQWTHRNKYGENPVEIRKEIQSCMQKNFSVFRNGNTMAHGIKELKEIRNRLRYAGLSDHSKSFNTHCIECLELDNLMETAYSTAISAYFRTESRGAHNRIDFPERDDQNWLCHSLYLPRSDKIIKRKVNMHPISREPFPVQKRLY